MKLVLSLLAITTAAAFCDSDELPHILVQEWGVLTWNGPDPVLTSDPPELVLFPTSADQDIHPAVRAPVLYFNGPEFSGTVTVETDNGSIFDIYPPVPDEDRTHDRCTWTADFAYERDAVYSDSRGLAPGEWNYENWRVEQAMGVRCLEGWYEKFLYYETAPETTSFLPYTSGMESLCDEYRDVEAIVIKNRSDGVFYGECTLEDVVYGGDIEYTEVLPDAIMDIVYGWSVDIIDPFQAEALWNTWSHWILRDHTSESAYSGGMVLYVIPAELCRELSIITVVPDADGPAYPVDISRFLLVAVPL